MHRWAQAQMFRSLAFLLSVQQGNSTGAHAGGTAAARAVRRCRRRTLRRAPGQAPCAASAACTTSDRAAAPSRPRVRAMAACHRAPRARRRGLSLRRSAGPGLPPAVDHRPGRRSPADVAMRPRSVWVVFNGEIYNFKELRRELEALGHVFRTRSDTEVIVHGYKQWGTDVLQRLNGMFGLAIWDVQRRSAGRWRATRRASSSSTTASTAARSPSARSCAPCWPRSPQRPGVDATALNLFLRYRYTPSPLTLYDGVRKLAPGTMLVVESGAARVERWHRHRPQRRARQACPMPRPPRSCSTSTSARSKRHLISRRAGRPAAERRHRLGPAARADEPVRQAPGPPTPSATGRPRTRTTSWPTRPRRRGLFGAPTRRGRAQPRYLRARAAAHRRRSSRSRSPRRRSCRCTTSASAPGRT